MPENTVWQVVYSWKSGIWIIVQEIYGNKSLFTLRNISTLMALPAWLVPARVPDMRTKKGSAKDTKKEPIKLSTTESMP